MLVQSLIALRATLRNDRDLGSKPKRSDLPNTLSYARHSTQLRPHNGRAAQLSTPVTHAYRVHEKETW
ncbi:hypothetical protein CcaverHIS631_0104660 [Cutaneotrichosporon cavernicola]|nr:hypothetical protein CcaverHIS631_0104660 [Cutaneotrichosporon cavernicola]